MTGCVGFISHLPPPSSGWDIEKYRVVEGGLYTWVRIRPDRVRIQPTCQKEAVLQKRARAAGSTVPDGSAGKLPQLLGTVTLYGVTVHYTSLFDFEKALCTYEHSDLPSSVSCYTQNSVAALHMEDEDLEEIGLIRNPAISVCYTPPNRSQRTLP